MCIYSPCCFIFKKVCSSSLKVKKVIQVSNTNTSASSTTVNGSHQILYFYEEIQNVEYEEPDRFRTVACINNSGKVDINTYQEKMDPVSIIPNSTSLSTGENLIYENQPETDKRDINALYLTPTM